jgi:hypothetical protein
MKMSRHIDERTVLVAISSYHADTGFAVSADLARVNPIGALGLNHWAFVICYLAFELNGIVDTGDTAWTNDVFKDAVRLEHDMFAVTDFYLFANDRIDKRQLGEFAVKEIRQGFADLLESRFANEHAMKDTILRIRLRVLFDTSAREGSVAYIHREEQIIDRFFPIHPQHHMLRFMLNHRRDESEDIVHMMRTDIMLE